MRHFIGESACTEVSAGCYAYCPGVCFRSYRYVLDPEGTEEFGLRVCKADNQSDCTTFPGSRRGPREPRTFIGHMPVGSDYVAYFLDGSGNLVDLPPIAEEQYEVNLCGAGAYSVSLVDTLASSRPSAAPTPSPTSNSPSASPTLKPSREPTTALNPTPPPSSNLLNPTKAPSMPVLTTPIPSDSTDSPSVTPAPEPSSKPTTFPSPDPTDVPAHSPTLLPVQMPIQEAEPAQEMAPTQAQQDSGSPNCFSGNNEIVVKGRGITAMKNVRVGDYVLSQGADTFSRVYSLAHLDRETRLEYLRIFYKEGGHIEISDRHYIQANGSFVTADRVQPGDIMVGSGSAHRTVSHVDRVVTDGLFAPLTESGTIIVSGVLVSNYVALLDTTCINQHDFIHMIVSPVRMTCRILPSLCENETHTCYGISRIFLPAISLASLIQRMPWGLQWLTSFLTLPFLCFFWLIDHCLLLMTQHLWQFAIFVAIVLAPRSPKQFFNSKLSTLIAPMKHGTTL